MICQEIPTAWYSTWSAQQKSIIKDFFKKHIQKKITPKKRRMSSFTEQPYGIVCKKILGPDKSVHLQHI